MVEASLKRIFDRCSKIEILVLPDFEDLSWFQNVMNEVCVVNLDLKRIGLPSGKSW